MKDLSERSENKKLGISKITFGKYYELPGIISDRLFAVFDQDKNDFLDLEEFTNGMTILFCENFDKLARFIFYFYDFDKDGLISKEDVRTVLSYVPLNTKKTGDSMRKGQEEFVDRVESQEELHTLLEKCFKGVETMDINMFMKVIEDLSSDIFLFILIFLLEKRPFSKKSMNEYENKKKLNSNPLLKFTRTPQITVTNKFIASPSMNSKFSPSVSIGKSPYMNKRLMASQTPLVTSDRQNLLNRLAGKPTIDSSSSKNVLMKYSKPVQPVKEVPLAKEVDKKDEDLMQVDEEVKIKALPVFRKVRNNLKNLESVSPNRMNIDSEMNDKHTAELEELQISSARKYQSGNGGEPNSR